METYSIKNLSFAYPNSGSCALSELDLTVSAGEWVTVCGRSGCGKTTLLRLLKSALAPGGEKAGGILFEGVPLDEVSARTQAERIGFVMQNPETQIVTDKVWHELAFGLESLGLSTDTIRLRCAEIAAFFGIQDWYYRDTASLSGGQKQLLNLAAVMVMQPSVLLLDEPTSQLDPIAASEFLNAVHKINRELGVTVILTEHRLEEALPLSDRIVVMEKGRVFAEGNADEVSARLRSSRHGMFRAMPAPMRVHAAVESSLPCPLTVREGREWLDEFSKTHTVKKDVRPRARHSCSADSAALELKRVWFRYDKDGSDVLRGVNLSVFPGTICALLGGNGAGKTTALSLAADLYSPQQGKIVKNGKLGMLPQNPRAMFLKETLAKDLAELGSSPDEIARAVELCRLEELLSRHPFDLSGGEMQRAALAKVLLTSPDILLLDEPTKGMDAEFKDTLADILLSLRSRGAAILMVSHDVEFCAKWADTCAMMFDGEIVSSGAPREFFGGNSFYTTAANRMSRHMIDGAVTAEDVIAACGGAEEESAEDASFTQVKAAELSAAPAPDSKKLKPYALIAAIACLVLVPLTIWFGIEFLDDRRYYLVSLAVILELTVPFFLMFEKRKPPAREIVLIAALCAIGVVGRMAFFWLPQFKPIAALIIIAAVALGAERGFLVGAVTGFASNMFFGQGPWTLWQMFAFGVIGFFAGLIFRNKSFCKSKLALCAYGFLSIILLYGGILNPASEIMFQGYLTREMLILSYIRGFPFDLIHAVGTVIFLWIAAKPMLLKLDRIKEKYGIK